MPTKLKGMTSLEIAIIVAIVLIIAVAVGWYLYTTFIASATAEPRLSVISAEITVYGGTATLTIIVFNPGPVNVRIDSIEVAGYPINTMDCAIIDGPGIAGNIGVGGKARCTGYLSSSITPRPGTMLPGRVILSGGQSFPFNAPVKGSWT
jgi:type IV pilus assembly protein PilA